ncbi:hypothetical protein TSAR_012748 [Trichomalopsis sarcophagae]|uniref:Uncharacterized protein n=1 Tax=Trichomalopsis sarcophagae TaxID=543379 RepID=A0A232EK74_9HYME|nr:hypothetical protein TSAR_012748 [Trichomalopsis sarcophagae]
MSKKSLGKPPVESDIERIEKINEVIFGTHLEGESTTAEEEERSGTAEWHTPKQGRYAYSKSTGRNKKEGKKGRGKGTKPQLGRKSQSVINVIERGLILKRKRKEANETEEKIEKIKARIPPSTPGKSKASKEGEENLEKEDNKEEERTEKIEEEQEMEKTHKEIFEKMNKDGEVRERATEEAK